MEINPMLEQALTFPALMESLLEPLAHTAETMLSDPLLQQIDQIYLYGSGDSLNAAVCAAQAFAQFAKIPTTPISALQASRYLATTLTPEQAKKVLAVCISNSGEAARTVEATIALRTCGCCTAILTANPDSRAGRAAEYVFHLEVPAGPPSAMPLPGTRSFVAPVLALYFLAISFGQRRGQLTTQEAQALRDELRQLPGLVQNAFTDGDSTLRKFAHLCGNCKRLEFLGAGPCRGAGDFGLSKVLEAVGTTVLSQDMEEYAHQTFFSIQPESLPTVLTVPSQSRAVQRCHEILYVVSKQGRPTLLLTDDAGLAAHRSDVVCLRRTIREEWSSLVFACIITYLTALIPQLPGDTYMHGHSGPYAEDGMPTVRESKLMI